MVDRSRNIRKEEGSEVGRIQYHFYNSSKKQSKICYTVSMYTIQ